MADRGVAVVVVRSGDSGSLLPQSKVVEIVRFPPSPDRLRCSIARVVLAVAWLGLPPGLAPQDRQTAIEALSQGRNEEALRILAELLDQAPRDHSLLTLRGIALAQAGRPIDALAAYRSALKQAPNYLAALQGAAEIEFQRRDPAALIRLEKAISIQSANPTAHAMLGVLAFERQDCGEAIRHFAEAAPAIVRNTPVLGQYGQCLFREGEASEAAQVFRQLLNLEPTDSAARFNLALSLFEASRYPDSIDVIDPLATLEVPASEVLSLLADAQLSLRRVPEALETLKRAAALHPRQERHYVDLANLCMEQEAHNLGLEILAAGIMNIPRSARLHGMRGILLAQLNRFEEAEAEFERATELDPDQSPGRIGLSITLQQVGRHAESIPILREQAAAEPHNPVVNTMLGRALIQEGGQEEGSLEEARAALERAVSADPSFVGAWVELGKLFMKTDRIEEAVPVLERAVKSNPDNRQAVYQLMLALRKAGRLDETRSLAQKLRTMVVRDQREETQQARFRLVREAPPDR